jgi:outer membrane receptor protein involved in Fe transport
MRIGSLLLLLSLSNIVVAQSDSAEKSPLAEVVVTTQRIEQRIISVPFAVKKLEREYFEQTMPRTLPEAMQGMNDVFVQKTTHGGGSAFLRGLTGNQILILVDGIRLNNSTFRYGPNQYLNTIDPYSVGGVEVAKGTGSVQYGSDALGGVIHVLTQEPLFASVDKGKWIGKVISKYMTGNMEKTGRGEVGFSSKKLAVAGGVTVRNFGDLIGGDTTGKQSPSGYSEWAMNVKAKFRVNDKVTFTAAHQNLAQQHVPVYYRIALENFALNEFDRQQRQLQFVRLDIKGNRRLLEAVKIIGSRQQSLEGRKSRKVGSATLRQEEDGVTTIGITADVLSTFTNQWRANTGVEVYQDRVTSSRKDINLRTAAESGSRGLYPDGARYSNFSLYSLHHIQYGKWLADAGLRFNVFSIRLNDTGSGRVALTPSALVWNSGISYQVRSQQYLYVSYSTGYRAPNVDDLSSLGVVDFRYEIPTFGLRPERSANIELGYKMAGKSWKGDIAIYRMQLRDLVTRIKMEGEFVNGYAVYRKENVEKALVRGVEAEIAWNPISWMTVNGSLTYTHGNNETKNEPLRRIPPTHGRIMTTLQKKSWSASAEWLMAARQNRLAKGDKEDIRINPLGTPGWQVLNLYGSIRFGKLQSSVGLQNLLDKDYRTHGSGINAVGRSGWVSLSLNL